MLFNGQEVTGATFNGVELTGLSLDGSLESFLPGDVVVKEISFGENSMHVLASDGTVWVAGENTYGQLGTGSTDEVNRLVDEPGVVYDFNAAPVKVTNADGSEFNGVTQVVGGRYDTVFLKDDGTVWGCGRNEYGMIGGSSTSPTLSPTQYTYNNEPIQGITKIAAGTGFAMFLQSDGLAFGQGRNTRGQLNQLMANGERIDQIVDITCGGGYTSYLRSDGTVWGAGFSGEGALGNFNYNNLDVIQLMKGDGTPFDNVAKIFSGNQDGGHNHFILNNGEVWGVGSNGHGTLGTGEQGAFPLPNHSVPQQCIIQDVEHISHIMMNSLFLKNDGTIWYCGQGSMTYSQWQQPTGAYSTPTQLTHIPTVAEKLYSGGINHIGYTDQDNDAYYFGKYKASPAKIQDPWAHQPPLDEIYFADLNGESTEMIYVEPGTFTQGSPESENGHSPYENQREVTLTKGFYLGKYAVTQAQYEAVMTGNTDGLSATPSQNGGKPNRPVEQVSWNDIQIFLTRLNQQQAGNLPEGWEYALPTEAEWEYACRAGTTTAYSFGSTITTSQANYGNSVGETADVGSYPPNPWGFFDMHGNAAEWVKDAFDGYYPSGPVTDPYYAGYSFSERHFRGGYYSAPDVWIRSASRGRTNADNRYQTIGFRLAIRNVS